MLTNLSIASEPKELHNAAEKVQDRIHIVKELLQRELGTELYDKVLPIIEKLINNAHINNTTDLKHIVKEIVTHLNSNILLSDNTELKELPSAKISNIKTISIITIILLLVVLLLIFVNNPIKTFILKLFNIK